ncbi:hypothetical protein U1Q18_052696 [Sarracenia purpurea var. burkii]
MPNPFAICLISLHKRATKLVQQIKSLRKIKAWNIRFRRKPKKRPVSDFNWLTSSFAAMEASNQLKQVFEFLDANGDGKISPLEIRQVLLNLGHEKSVAAKEAEGMVREMDRDGDGFVDVDEFLRVVDAGNEPGGGDGEENDLRDAFVVFDSDKNGFIDAEELQRVLISLGYGNCSLKDCRQMIKGVDRDGDGLVDFEEFRSMMGMAR